MKQKLLNNFRLRAVMLVAMMCAAFTGARADDAYYTLDTTGSTQTNNNGYANTGTVTVDGIGWSFNGNGQINPWRLGGKSLTEVDRAAYTTTAMGAAINRIELTVGAASGITVNSLTLIVASDASFGTVLDEVEEDFEASSTITFEPTSGSSWATGSYYKFVFNVTVSGSSNKFVQFSKVEFYEYTGGGGGSSAVATTTAIDASGITNTDIYAGTEAGTLSATVSAGETIINNATITWSGNNDAVATIDASTGAVTLVAAGSVTFTATYAGVEDTYSSSIKTYVMTVTNSDPNVPGTENNPYTVAEARAAIDAGTGVTGVYATGVVTEIVTAYGTNNYNNVTFNIVDQEGDEDFLQAYRCVGDDAPNVSVGDIVVVSGNLTKYKTTYEFAQGCEVVSLQHPVITTPYFTAENVNIEYNASAGEIAYTVENPVNGGSVTASTTSDWLTLGSVFTSPIAFTCDANTAAAARTATVTLTYTYGNDETVTKDVTVTQAGNPDVVNNISDITEVGTTYTVRGTVVATNSRGFVIGDGTGYVYYYKNAAPTQTVGEIVSISGTTGTYGQIIQFTSSATVAEATVSSYNGNPQPTTITEVPDYSTGYHLSTYLEFEGTLTKSSSNYLVTIGESQIQISYPTTDQGTALTALVDKTVRVHGFFSGINSSSKFTVMLESVEEVATPTITITPDTYNMDAKAGGGELPVVCANLATDPQLEVVFVEADGVTPATYDWISAEINNNGNIDGQITANTGDARTAYFYVKGVDADNNVVKSNLVTFTQQAAATEPYIMVNTTEWNVDANGGSKTFGFDYENLGDNPTFEVAFFDQTGETKIECGWISYEFVGDKVTITASNNDENSARTAYFKVCAEVNKTMIYSNLVTVNQAVPVVDYATLPFSWDDTNTPNGITTSGVGTYKSSPYMKFDDSGDYIILKINERPGTLTFDIKGNSFSGSTFKVQTSADGETYTDLKTYTELGATQSETFNSLSADVRYIKWIYTEKVTNGGNVALGNIALARFVPSITIEPEVVNIDAVVGDELISSTITTVGITGDLHVQYYDVNGNEIKGPEWCPTTIHHEMLVYNVQNNTSSEALTAYMKVYGTDANNNTVYSNLVTVNQAGFVPSITIEPEVVNIDAVVGDELISSTITTVGITGDLHVKYYDVNGNEIDGPEWCPTMIHHEMLVYNVEDNTSSEALTAYMKVYGTDANNNTVYSNLVTVNQAANVPTTTYSLATSITAGKHYLIVGSNSKTQEYYAMGLQNNNNRAATAVSVNNGQISITDENVAEVVVYGPDASGNYTIYDAETGYLYAASSSSNHLKSQYNNDLNGKWAITFNALGYASVEAKGDNTRNVMQFNSGNTLFSCYSSDSQSPVYFFEKDNDDSEAYTANVTLNAFGYATFASNYALDFLDNEDANYSAWQIAEVDNNTNTITFEQITGMVAPATGILLKGKASDVVALNVLPAGGATLGNNKLEGITESTQVEDNQYFGLKGNEFVKVNTGVVPAGKALLPIDNDNPTAGVKSFTLIFNDADGIQTIETVSAEKAQAIFNLAGQRLPKAQKGINIINGKKVLVK